MPLKETLKEHAEVAWFIVMLILVGVFVGWNIVGVSAGSSTSYRYGLPLFSGMPKFAQNAVLQYEKDPNGTIEDINGVLVVNMTVTQPDGYKPDLIVAQPGQPVAIIVNSPQIITGFFLRLPNGVVQINSPPGYTTYAFFYAPKTPGNYTWREPEYAGYNFSYWTGTLEVK
ncbi:proton pump complex quinol oxidase subunit SoxA [Acidianus sp. RZ1]|uniref:proton pump complex quinol oxidase subunit SoxA n=1 Tax=Acidianus sp. RZ1 TaxID=1540082 RepID=UPI001490CE69|nr:proton pump complex quinol oxidase subunit SoxA [Acidianus sp. RZ1]NON62246.1 cytochrome c oxidase subunit II [Acidianus sp. RZ1]